MINLKNLTKINDVFYISHHIKKLNPNFDLFFNTLLNRYEIHNLIANPSFVISFYDYPDNRIIDKLLKTNKDNMANLFKEIEEQNALIEINKNKDLLDKSKNQINELFNFINKKPSQSLDKSSVKNILEKEDLIWQKI